jgi:phosphocarrier protein FPr/phosphocarrier protein
LPYEIEIRARGRAARARSTVALMSLGIRGGDEVVIAGFEARAATGVAAIAEAIRNLEAVAAHPPAPAAVAVPAGSNPRGVIASRGIAVGPAFYLQSADIAVIEAGQGVDVEQRAFDRARDTVRARLAELSATALPAVREIMTAHLELLDDPQIVDAARLSMSAGSSAGYAWRASLRASAEGLKATGDTRLAERVDDLLDLERQVLVALDGAQAPSSEIPAGGILLARDLTPSQLIDIEAGALGGIALASGGPTSHVAILAGTLGIPMLVAAGPELLAIPAGTSIILDADEGVLHPGTDARELSAMRARLEQRREQRGATSPRHSRIAASRAASASRCLPISPVPPRMRRWPFPRVRKAAASCAQNSCFSNAPPRPMKKSSGAATSWWRRSSAPARW